MAEERAQTQRIEDTKETLERVEGQDDSARLEFLEELHDRLEGELEERPSPGGPATEP